MERPAIHGFQATPGAVVAVPAGATLLVDASSYLFRAWFGVPDIFHDRRGRPLNAVVGFAKTLAALLGQARPARAAVAFDEALFSGFRHRIDPGYKAGRALPDADLAWQMQACRRLVEGLGMVALASHEFEADDLLAALAAREAGQGRFSVIASEDKDLAQALAGPDDLLWQFARQRILSAADIRDWLGVEPRRHAEFLALTGDPIDGIAGVPGIGKQTAALLLSHCEHIDELLQAPTRVADLPVRGAARLAALLAEHGPRVRHNLRLTMLATGSAGLPAPASLVYLSVAEVTIRDLMRDLGLPDASARHFLPAEKASRA